MYPSALGRQQSCHATYNALFQVHGCLLSLSYAIKLMKCELADEFTENQPKLIRNLDDISASISSHSCGVQCKFNQLILQDVKALLTTEEHFGITAIDAKDYHPGARDLLINYGPKDLNNTLDGCKNFISKIKSSPTPSKSMTWEVLNFLEENTIISQKVLLIGPMVEDCAKFLRESKSYIMDDCELAMAVLQVVSHPNFLLKKLFGTSAASACISISAIAIASMVLKVSTW